MAQLGRLPKEGDRTTLGNVVIHVDQMQGRRIQWLTLRLREPTVTEHDVVVPGTVESTPGPGARAKSRGGV